jgi:hypothetical protein
MSRTTPHPLDSCQQFHPGGLDAAIDAVSVSGKTGSVLLNF